ncbi:hypothetical protein B2A_15471 [mine drainage metagenome]|uniref:Uncharacterized protein n=1 Tax=mine drainage metagenome TaxID=410659 RepID=T0ZDK3_9ZZZZ
MAALARLIRTLIERTFSGEGEAGELHGQLEAFRKVLIESLTTAVRGYVRSDDLLRPVRRALQCAGCGLHAPERSRRAAQDQPLPAPHVQRHRRTGSR